MPQHFTLQPLSYADIPAVTKLSADAFIADRHTQMKGFGKVPYNMEDESKSDLPDHLKSEKCVCIKAVNNTTGEIMGWASWGLRGFAPGEVTRMAIAEEKFDPIDKPIWKDEKARAEGHEADHNLKSVELNDDDVIGRLNAMEDDNITQWMKKLMPEGTKCMFVAAFSVDPKFQRQGVGAALLGWGADVADKHNVFTWVHSSEPAWKAYQKAGFETIGTLDLDLDEWAPVPPPKEEGEGAKWGNYTIRYMKRLPKNN